MPIIVVVVMIGKLVLSWWVWPCLVYRRLKANGFSGPKPSFPLGNLRDMRRGEHNEPRFRGSCLSLSNDIHSAAFPYFSGWQKSHGKVFIYWLGTEPFLYIADPEFLKQMTADINGRSWGKPTVFKNDREPMFGQGLLMVEGEDWVRHRHVITPAFSPSNLKAMANLMVDSATNMMDRWAHLIASGQPEIDVEREIIGTAGEIIAKTSFGISYENGRKVLEKLRDMQITLFRSNRYVGVPFGKFLNPTQNLKAKTLGKEVDDLLQSIIVQRTNNNNNKPEQDLLGLLLTENTVVDGRKKRALTAKELVDECKTFFFGGHETTALALTWTLLLLAKHPEWQKELREEIAQVMGGGNDTIIEATKLVGLKKMECVLNEVLRLYPPAPNVQRQARHDIRVGDLVIPNGTNMWIDVVSMHHDETMWGKDVNEFKPERFKDSVHGGCKHKMGFLPFGFGGRMCVGRNLTIMEYKIVLSLILSRFSFSLSPSYVHAPSIMLSLRPMHGLPLIVKAI
ncbi:cytochrome P450- family 715- subfamily A-polypeptide 1 [Striga hermonthica]|uniref:Cytochrome P450- family 715- subfamily A-polypeptide 1 n=1 Tax=Striga hermonthica TaxID=68872 RepID=A0A9N7NH70_STRHE|nr:cytochrome P450- family 715- subfamily A-polypeptide 1 [Striga hermonthica]